MSNSNTCAEIGFKTVKLNDCVEDDPVKHLCIRLIVELDSLNSW